MPIHIGEMIKAKAEELKMAQEALGTKINRSKQNVGDIYKRRSIDTELLLSISKAMEFDFFEVYYSEEPLKSRREADLAGYQSQIAELKEIVAYREQRITDLERAAESDKKLISFLEEERKEYRKK